MTEEPAFLTVGELSKATGATPRAIRLYESLGLISLAKRTSNGYRLFQRGELHKLETILAFRKAGISLKEILRLFSIPAESPTASAAAKSLSRDLARRAEQIAQTARALSALSLDLERACKLLAGCFDCNEPFDELSCGECENFVQGAGAGLPVSLKAIWPLRGDA